MLEIYPLTSGYKPSQDYKIEVNGQPVFCGGFAAGAHASFGMDEPVEVRIVPLNARLSGEPVVRPLRSGVQAVPQEDGSLKVSLTAPGHFYIESACGPDLMLFANPLELDKPDPADPNVRYFKAGKVHDGGDIVLESGQTLYIEGGAVVKGHVRAHGAHDVRVAGFGILDGRHYARGALRLMLFDGCQDVRVEGLLTIGTPSWNLVLGGCERVLVEGVKLVGWVVCSDGVDIVGSRDVKVRRCFLRNNDDCVVVKALDMRHPGGVVQHDWRQDVYGVRVEECVLYNDKAGNAMEVGFETRTANISDVQFKNIDVIGAHGEGAVFSIHNGDRAQISGIRWEDIRIEHFYDKLLDFRVMHSRYSKDEARGTIRDIAIHQVRSIEDNFNCTSLISGYDAGTPVKGVHLSDFYLGDRQVLTPDDLNLFTRHADPVSFS